MGLDINAALDSAAAWLCSSRIVNRVISNPVFTALLITALAVIVVMATYHYCLRKAGWKRVARMSIYLLLVVSAVVFVHFYAVGHRVKAESMQSDIRSTFQSINDIKPIDGRGEHPVDIPVRGDGDEAVGAGDGNAIGGGSDVPCPCKGAPSSVSGAAQPAGSRPDNIELGDGRITIADVTVPSSQTPL